MYLISSITNKPQSKTDDFVLKIKASKPVGKVWIYCPPSVAPVIAISWFMKVAS